MKIMDKGVFSGAEHRNDFGFFASDEIVKILP